MADLLIVDDSAICRELLCRSLEVHGYSTESASLGDAAALLQGLEPRLIIVDPGGADGEGWKFLAALRCGAGNRNLQIVIVTDQSNKQSVMQAATLGVRDYMLKARFSLAELLTRVRRHVAPSASPYRPGAPTGVISPSPANHKPPATQPPAEPTTRTPPSTPAAPAHQTSARAVPSKLIDFADEIGIKRSSREETLERLESAPVKTLPGVVAELISLVNSPRGTVADVAQILRRDPIMTARLLRVANSAAFTSQRARVASVEDAVKNIGVAGVRNLIVNVGVFDAFASEGSGGLRVTRVWQHCLGVAMLMDKLAPRDDPSVPPGSAYLVGLCHDLADIILRQHFSGQYDAIGALMDKSGCSLRAAEKAVFGLPYSEFVSQLLSRLRLPPLITLPIEEFYDREEKMVSPGAGSTLSRWLRAANVYVHGLLLSPDAQQPITPLTRAECLNTFGNGAGTCDDELLRGEAIATASMLAGLTASQTEQMCQPLVPQMPITVSYCRHNDYAQFDPLMAILKLTARQVQLLPPLKKAEAAALGDSGALIVAGPRSADNDALQIEIGEMRRLLKGRPIAALHLGNGGNDMPADAAGGITLRRLPLNIASLGEFLAGNSDATRKGSIALAA